MWVISEPRRGNTLLDMLITNKEELVKNTRVKGSLGSSDCETS